MSERTDRRILALACLLLSIACVGSFIYALRASEYAAEAQRRSGVNRVLLCRMIQDMHSYSKRQGWDPKPERLCQDFDIPLLREQAERGK